MRDPIKFKTVLVVNGGGGVGGWGAQSHSSKRVASIVRPNGQDYQLCERQEVPRERPRLT